MRATLRWCLIVGMIWGGSAIVVGEEAVPPTPAPEAAPPPATPAEAAPATPPATPPAAEPPATPSPAEAAAPAAPAATQAEFDRLFTEWKAILGKLRQLVTDYRAAEPAKKGEIRTQFNAEIAKGEESLPKLSAAAEAVFVAAPDPEGEPAEFLAGLVHSQARMDDFEPCLRLANLLFEKGVTDPTLYAPAGMAAFATADYDLAEKYFKLANENGKLGEEVRNFAETIPYYREMWPKEQQIRAAEAEKKDLPRVRLKTTKGDIVVELFENEAPNTVANFITLVEKGFYTNVSFHRVLPHFMAQGGYPKGDGSGGPGYDIPDEHTKPNYRLHFRGSLSMANTGQPNSGGSQFFLNFVPTQHLDGRHTVFGRVVEGFEVLGKLQRRSPDDPGAPEPDKILEAKVESKRPHEYVVKKAGE